MVSPLMLSSATWSPPTDTACWPAFADYRLRDGVVVITHEVDRRFRGRGLGNELASRTLDLLRVRGARVLPVCPFFARYVADHPEYGDIVES
jgi:predicted GNAT family acetyltransferase